MSVPTVTLNRFTRCTATSGNNFRQHVKGYHGSGFKSLCGIIYKWPKQCREHQVDCDDCKSIRKERKEKPVNPNHFKDRKTWKM